MQLKSIDLPSIFHAFKHVKLIKNIDYSSEFDKIWPNLEIF